LLDKIGHGSSFTIDLPLLSKLLNQYGNFIRKPRGPAEKKDKGVVWDTVLSLQYQVKFVSHRRFHTLSNLQPRRFFSGKK
jgi:hypothetical protein